MLMGSTAITTMTQIANVSLTLLSGTLTCGLYIIAIGPVSPAKFNVTNITVSPASTYYSWPYYSCFYGGSAASFV